ncbi:hypothetical protein PQB35_gp07 [Ochrobactrum phage vB_OspP_OH]|uniref:Uncharacterized protein n=1 Tax=Ochrobactrum phage vB_OspP_OH TaxID=2712957 RepID=A0A6G6XXT5_9CAUD|nr:hypothetical protein PQB35_gp07 [Ochrobactrum phage vB_OspP_OH]QIG66063.1 hypothetical protein phiOH_p07 [Ochrobactrum phage vB_OspP_OH]
MWPARRAQNIGASALSMPLRIHFSTQHHTHIAPWRANSVTPKPYLTLSPVCATLVSPHPYRGISDMRHDND